MQRLTLVIAMTATLFGAGCAGGVGYTATVSNEAYGPDLVYAAPGVQVIADYDEPIFYADNYYWRYNGGGWYRSPHYTGGWVYATPPGPVLRIERPHTFVHYRPAGWTGHRQQGPRQPPARDDRPRVAPTQRGQPPAPPMYQPPPPTAPPPSRGGPSAPRGRDHHDNRDHRDDDDHGDRHDGHDHHDNRDHHK